MGSGLQVTFFGKELGPREAKNARAIGRKFLRGKLWGNVVNGPAIYD